MWKLGLVATSLLCCVQAYALSHDQAANIDYEKFSTLPYNVQSKYLDAVQAVLVEMDSERPNSHAALDWIFNQVVCSADADINGNGPFCINLGVVQLNDGSCPVEKKDFHNFNTEEVFDKLNLNTSKPACAEGKGMPCSPFFGFQADGNFLCSVPNSTINCERQSKKAKALPLIDVLRSCANTKTPGIAKVNCEQLGTFFNQQNDILLAHCAHGKVACRTLFKEHLALADELNKLATTDKAAVDKIAQYLADANAHHPVVPPSPKCPPEDQQQPPAHPPLKPVATGDTLPKPQQPPVAPQPAPPTTQPPTPPATAVTPPDAQPVGTPIDIACDNKTDASDPKKYPDQDLIKLWKDTLAKKGNDCIQVTTPSGAIFKLTKNELGRPDVGVVQLPKQADGTIPKPIRLSGDTVDVMLTLSGMYETAKDSSPLSIDPASLFDYYLPVTPVTVGATGITYQGNSRPSWEYTTATGTVIRYGEQDSLLQLININIDGTNPNTTVFPHARVQRLTK